MKKLGVIVNPVAGMGGRVGLKGSDGIETVRQARKLGAIPESPRRATGALQVLTNIEDKIEIITDPHEMGEDEARACGFAPTVVGAITNGETTSEDTCEAARKMEEMGVDMLLFAGGDGTARDVYNAVGLRLPALGIPAGVKIHSGVYAVTPRDAGELALLYLTGKLAALRDAEVMDIDEEAFRRGQVMAKLYGYLRIPEDRHLVQGVKSGGTVTEKEALQGIATEVIESMEADCFYIVGPGTTTSCIVQRLGLKKTLLGVDIILNKKLIASDVNEAQILKFINDRQAKVIVSVIGGQGYILGRGNQQLSPDVMKRLGRKNLIVVASKDKLAALGGSPLLVDTGDEQLNQTLSGYTKVTTGFRDYVMCKVGR